MWWKMNDQSGILNSTCRVHDTEQSGRQPCMVRSPIVPCMVRNTMDGAMANTADFATYLSHYSIMTTSIHLTIVSKEGNRLSSPFPRKISAISYYRIYLLRKIALKSGQVRRKSANFGDDLWPSIVIKYRHPYFLRNFERIIWSKMLKVTPFITTGEAANLFKTPCFVADRTMHGASNHAWFDAKSGGRFQGR